MRNILILIVLICVSANADEQQVSELARLLSSGEQTGFARAVEPRAFDFPADHGPHESFRNEWWYFTGNLDADSGDRFGYELTIFRFSLTAERDDSSSAFRTNQIYIAHLALTDVAGERFLVAEKYSRGGAGLAGATGEPFRVWIDDWQVLDGGQGVWELQAETDDFGLSLQLEALKPIVLNGASGLSLKSSEPGNASYYYSIPRLRTEGSVRIGDQRLRVAGESWLDREWSTSALADDQAGWDWFALQLSDQTELMFYSLRKTDGTQDGTSSGTRTYSDGTYRHLQQADVELTVTDYWTSPAGGTYPAGWILEIPEEELRVKVTPVLADQELFTLVRYWEGAVDVSGTRGSVPINGRGYVELTGYAESAD